MYGTVFLISAPIGLATFAMCTDTSAIMGVVVGVFALWILNVGLLMSLALSWALVLDLCPLYQHTQVVEAILYSLILSSL